MDGKFAKGPPFDSARLAKLKNRVYHLNQIKETFHKDLRESEPVNAIKVGDKGEAFTDPVDDQVLRKIGTKKADSEENRDEDDDDVGISQTKVDDGKSGVENDDGSSDDGEVSSSEESSSDQDQASLSALTAESEVKPGEIHKSAIVSANDEEEEGKGMPCVRTKTGSCPSSAWESGMCRGVANAIMFQPIVQDGALLAFSDHSTSLGKANIAEFVMPSAVNCFEDGEVKGITPKCGPSDGDKCSQASVSSPKQNQPIGATSWASIVASRGIQSLLQGLIIGVLLEIWSMWNP
ncbi:hypothetical protein U1Q18_037545 [Sarracenia purpurea var. burkii]